MILPRLILFIFLIGLIAACVPQPEMIGAGVEKNSGEGIFGYREEDIDALQGRGFKRFPLAPVEAENGTLLGKRGLLGKPITTQSGQSLEIRWEGLFPRYRLYYFPNAEHPGVVIGECRFPDGCNNGFFFGPDRDNNGIPDSIRVVVWVSSDYGRDDEVPGYLDRYRYVYDASRDRHYVWHDLLIYRCTPPLSNPPDTCRTTCDPPYEVRTVGGKAYPRIHRTRLVEEKGLLGP